MRCIASGARPPDLSLRGGRRPTWQSRGTCRIIGKPSAKSQLPSRDCTPRALPRASRSGRHVGLRPPRNDKSVCLAPLNYCCNTRNCLRRSGSAATDAIGAHHANDSLYQFAGAAPSVAHPRIRANRARTAKLTFSSRGRRVCGTVRATFSRRRLPGRISKEKAWRTLRRRRAALSWSV